MKLSWEDLKKYWRAISVSLLILANIIVAYSLYREWPTNYLTLAILNVGQGTAIYIESPFHHRLLIDGGSGRTILNEVRKCMPFFARSFDSLLLTSLDDDHTGGFIDIVDTYTVGQMFEPDATTSSLIYAELKKNLTRQAVSMRPVRRGTTFHFGDGVNLTILYPDTDSSSVGVYEGPVMAKLTFGSSSALITGGEPAPFEKYIMAKDGKSVLESQILTLFYNSARNEPDADFIQAVDPRWITVSASSKKVSKTPVFAKSSTVSTLLTSESGTIIFHCTVQKCTLVKEALR